MNLYESILKESYDNGTWVKYQNEIESILEKAHDSMEEDAFVDFCTGVINLCQNYMGDLDQYDGYLESEFTTPCTDDGSELAKSYGLTVKSKEKTSDTSTPYVCKFVGPKDKIVKMIKEKFNSGDDSVTEEIIKEIKDSENETKECDTPMKESNYDESIFASIENALTDSGLDVTRYVDAGMMTKNIGWVVSNSEGEVNLTCDGTYLSEGDHHSKECNCKECQLNRLNERVENLKERCSKDKLVESGAKVTDYVSKDELEDLLSKNPNTEGLSIKSIDEGMTLVLTDGTKEYMYKITNPRDEIELLPIDSKTLDKVGDSFTLRECSNTKTEEE